jgi:hypothetical protein
MSGKGLREPLLSRVLLTKLNDWQPASVFTDAWKLHFSYS